MKKLISESYNEFLAESYVTRHKKELKKAKIGDNLTFVGDYKTKILKIDKKTVTYVDQYDGEIIQSIKDLSNNGNFFGVVPAEADDRFDIEFKPHGDLISSIEKKLKLKFNVKKNEKNAVFNITTNDKVYKDAVIKYNITEAMFTIEDSFGNEFLDDSYSDGYVEWLEALDRFNQSWNVDKIKRKLKPHEVIW